MKYEEFKRVIYKAVKASLLQEAEVSLYTTTKNNKQVMEGLLVHRVDEEIATVVYLNTLFEHYKDGTDTDIIIQEIVQILQKDEMGSKLSKICRNSFIDYQKMLAVKLINTEQNQEFLKMAPHVEFQDLSIVFYLLLETTKEGIATMPVTYQHLEIWEISEKELYAQAMKNSPEILPLIFTPMSQVIGEIKGYHEPTEEKDKMYVVTNPMKSFGAGCLAYPHVLEQIRNILGENYYILPSSLHEILVVPESEVWSRTELDEMIQEINRTEVIEPGEILSDHSYFYNGATGKITY